MENRLLTQFNDVITKNWFNQEILENYEPLNHRELFEISFHTCNSVSNRLISLRLSQDVNKGGSEAILYSQKKIFTHVKALADAVKVTMYINEGSLDRLANEIHPAIKARKEKWVSKTADEKTQILKMFLVMRKLDECSNYVMTKAIARKVYFAIGDARESAAVIPLFMQAEGASLVQLALNKWMEAAQRLPQEEKFPDSHMPGILKNLMQIKKWLLNLISTQIE